MRGGEVSAELTVTPTLGEGGRLTGLRWQLRDITARARAEDALRAEKEFAEGLIEAAQVIVLIADDAARLVRANFYLEALSGFRPEELSGHLWHTRLLPSDDWARLRQDFERVVREGWTVRGTTRMQTKAGPTRVGRAAQPA